MKTAYSGVVDLRQARCYDSDVRPELQFAQHFRNISRQRLLLLFWGVLAAAPMYSQTQKPNIPDPIKFINKYEIVANVVRAVLDGDGFNIELEDRKGGHITTKPSELATGAMTSSEIEKYAVKMAMPTGSWLKAQYSVEAVLDIVSPTETMVTIRAKIEALNRNIDGTEKWVTLESLGTLERRILGKISTKLMGNTAPANERKGFWGQKPQPVQPRQPRAPTAPW
jgi:hypothetical protein